MKVVLTPKEILETGLVAVMRVTEVIQKGRQETHGEARDESWQRHFEGALGERAVAKAYNIYWHGAGKCFGTDIGNQTEVRTTTHPNGRLILHDEDDDDKFFVHVTGSMGEYLIRGWIRCGDGKDKKWWEDPQGKNRWAYFVPNKLLQSAETAHQVLK